MRGPPGMMGRGPPRGMFPPGRGPPPMGMAPGPGGPAFGKLRVTVIACRDIPAPKTGSGNDPYVKLRIGAVEQSSRVATGGKRNPQFGDEFEFDVGGGVPQQLDIEVWQKQPAGQDIRACLTRVGYMAWVGQGTFSGDLELRDQTRQGAGVVTVAAVFQRSAQAAAVAPPGARGAPSEAARDPNGAFTDREIKEAFLSFDLDHNNYVGAAEIRHILVNIGENVSDEEVDEMIRMVDKDGDGQVSFDEFYAMVTGGKAVPPGLWGGPGGAPSQRAPQAARAGAAGVTPHIQARTQRSAALNEFAKQFGLKPESIKSAYKRFQDGDADRSGMIDYGEYCHILGVEASPAVEKLFQMFDKDRSGQIDVREFMIGLSNFVGASKEEKLKFAFAVFDEDGNGVITKDELTRILVANHLASGAGEVQRKADTIMMRADKDGNGVISFDEFVQVSKKFPSILYPAYTLGSKMQQALG